MRVYEFEWGQNLITFSPSSPLSRQVAASRCAAGTRRRRRPSRTRQRGRPARAGSGRRHERARSRREDARRARRRSSSTRRSSSAGGSARARHQPPAASAPTSSSRERAGIGLPDLRPGDNVELTGLGKSLQRALLRHQGRAHARQHRLPHAVRRAALLRRGRQVSADAALADHRPPLLRRRRGHRRRRHRPGEGGARQASASRGSTTRWSRSGAGSRSRTRATATASFFVPEVGDEVLVAFVHGDMRLPDRPRRSLQRQRQAADVPAGRHATRSSFRRSTAIGCSSTTPTAPSG